MTMSKHTPGPWRLDIQRSQFNGKIIDCFVSAPDVNGFAYRAEIFGDDEYRDDTERKIADFTLGAAAPDLLADLRLAAAQLRKYEALHRAKGTEDGLAKAEVNATLAEQFEATIAKATGDAS